MNRRKFAKAATAAVAPAVVSCAPASPAAETSQTSIEPRRPIIPQRGEAQWSSDSGAVDSQGVIACSRKEWEAELARDPSLSEWSVINFAFGVVAVEPPRVDILAFPSGLDLGTMGRSTPKLDPSQWSPARRRLEAQIPDEARACPDGYGFFAFIAASGITVSEAARRIDPSRKHERAENFEACREIWRENADGLRESAARREREAAESGKPARKRK